MILSYAQNMEDVVLAAVFAGDPLTADGGVYVDVGGGHAVADNVTFALYLAGWRGVVVEPQARLAAAYANIRPRDAVVGALVGREPGEADFHEVERFHGFSTMVAEHAERAAGFGTSYATRKMPVTTLAALCGEHGLARIDLLKIDVEGAEGHVLAGNDWARFRPRVLCIEAVQPGSMDEAWGGWEPELLAKGYAFAHFDGLNRFYVAQEAAMLLARFPKAQPDWGSVAHLYDFGRPLDFGPPLAGNAHADHALAKALAEGFLALLPTLDPALIVAAMEAGAGERTPEGVRALMLGDGAKSDAPRAGLPPVSTAAKAEIAALLATDHVRAALARIACFHDGGHLIEDAPKSGG
jgi:FkbM family methyltransferase